MTLMSFLLASHALMVEHGFHVESEQAAPTPADVAERNAQAMSALMGAFSGVQGGPMMGGRR